MDANDLSALLNRFESEGNASPEALVRRRFVRKCSDCPLAARSDDDRAAERVKKREAVHQLQIVRNSLAEAESRINQDARPINARGLCGSNALFEPEIDFDEHVVVARVLLHTRRRST